ncbi:phage tail assembly protein [Salmonella enterica subsp. enterica serovar Newport]|nr:phage tail assembly protein [Salmonella enterica subsp. enterica serovar Newport]ECD5833272.1 phage tail assembly protein [Salmonella enterica subsp. enterica serovar Newport]ECJ3227607.1 phage tail assembly protein [Salmonella enterica]ECJ3243708.1 phage tail assembly protein [Salmonella enterica]
MNTDDFLKVTLRKPLEDESRNIRYETITLTEPVLMQVEQFYDMQKKSNALAAMRLLVSLVSGVPESIIRRLPYTEFRRCEEYMTGFLAWSPSGGGGN